MLRFSFEKKGSASPRGAPASIVSNLAYQPVYNLLKVINKIIILLFLNNALTVYKIKA